MKKAGEYKGTGRRVLIIVQNLPVPFDRRVWQEATTLAEADYKICIICPKGKGHEASYEYLNGVHIYRHPLPLEANGALGYALEYSISLFWEWLLAWKIFFTRGFDVIHACNPPDTIFLIAGFFKFFFGKKFLFDHHDINPELYEAKFARRGIFYRIMVFLERLTFATADISIATNYSYRHIAIERGKMAPEKVFVVRSGPSLERMKIVPPVLEHKEGKKFLVGYVGVIGQQEGIHYLIKAIHHIIYIHKRSDIHFAIIGDGPALAAMRLLAQKEKVTDAITFTGRIGDREMLDILNTADVCVNPDEVNVMNDKSTMNKIMEYMAIGKPIVQFDVTEGRFSAKEASLYAKANNLEDFADKIITLIDDPAMREDMGKIGRKRIEQELAWIYEAPKLLAAYDAIFNLHDYHGRLKWFYYRLRAMSLPEIGFRMLEWSKRKQHQYFGLPVGLTIFQSSEIELKGLREEIAKLNIAPEIIGHWLKQYEDAKTGNYHLLNIIWPGTISLDKWHFDPISNTLWTQTTCCFDIGYRNAASKGDVKYVWELNRLQYLQGLAVLAYKSNDAQIAQFCFSEIESWIDANPIGLGINWVSGIELALRAISIVLVTTLLNAFVSPQLQVKIVNTLHAHGYWIRRYPSRYSSANNHLVAEALGLMMIATACSGLAESEQWRQHGWKILCAEINNQILQDGVGAERSIAYTKFILEMFNIGGWLADRNGLPVSESYKGRLAAAQNWLCWGVDEKGNHPDMGDDDNAIATPEPLRDLFTCNVAEPADNGVRVFGYGGYSIGRFTSLSHTFLLAIDHGPLGYLSIAAHGHADALSVWLHIDGQPVFVDAGTYLYHSGGAWRDYFRSTAAHNTLRLAQADSSIMAGAFNWRHKANARLLSHQSSSESWQIKAEHDGYAKKFGVLHQRSLNVTFNSGAVIEDVLTGKVSQEVEIRFLIHPDLTVTEQAQELYILKNNAIILRMAHQGTLRTKIEQGWYSQRFGHKVPTAQIVFLGTLPAGQPAITHLRWA